jgi:hypothetical protein
MLTKEDQELRRTLVGASEIGALLNSPEQVVDPYKSPLRIFRDKTLPADEEKAHQGWGLDLEDSTVRFVVRRKGYELISPGTPDGKWRTLAHPTLPLCCTTDARVITKAGKAAIQAKNDQGHGQLKWGEEGTDDVPLAYLAQVVVEMGVLLANGYEVVHDEIAVSIRGAPPACYPIIWGSKCAELFGDLGVIAAKFKRDHLDTGKPPDGSPDDMAEYVRRRWATHDATLLQPTPEVIALWQQVARLKKQTKTLGDELTAAENALKAAIGEASGIVGLCTWKLQARAAHSVKESSFRVLRLLNAKEE